MKRQIALRTFLKGLSTFLCIIYTLLSIVSHSPQIHKWFHSDADSSNHSCALILIGNGNVDTSNNNVPVVLNLVAIDCEQIPCEFLKPINLHLLPSNRAPPFSI
ncbi:MAG: hypothetical protein ACP5T0_13010 [Verrucomicrobiia bacterium]